MTRIFDKSKLAGSAIALSLLAACHSSEEVPTGTAISCQPPGATTMAPTCTVEPTETPDGTVLTIHHPDGSFRRLLQVKDGRGVIAEDGAEAATVKAANNKQIEVSIAGAVYLLPAKVTP